MIQSSPRSSRCFQVLLTFVVTVSTTYLWCAWPEPAAAATFNVNSTSDGSDIVPGNGTCATSGGNCTLRAALQEANALSGLDAITFGIGSGDKTITPATALPTITDSVQIFGVTQPGYSDKPLIELNGTTASSNASPATVDGLRVTAAGCVIVGLIINRFSGDGVELTTPRLGRGGGDNDVLDNFIGTDKTGTTTVGFGNGGAGVYVNDTANNSISGGFCLLSPCSNLKYQVVSGNGGGGVVIDGAAARGNVVARNRIGTDRAGTVARGNTGAGISITNDATGNTIGGTNSTARNVIAGNTGPGILLAGPGNFVQGNYVSVNSLGNAGLGNGDSALVITSANNTIGGTSSAARNIFLGILLDGSGATGNKVQGNYIGLNAGGTVALGGRGVVIQNLAGGNTIGGVSTRPGTPPGNVIAGSSVGVDIAGNGTSGPANNLVQGNFIGTSANGRSALPNVTGVRIISGAHNNTIGGTVSGARNVISGNTSVGVAIGVQNNYHGGPNNIVQGNYIGTDETGAARLPNGAGVVLWNASGNQIGGGTAGAGNVITGNTGNGVYVNVFGASVTDNFVQGNFIGTSAAGDAALGNGGRGVHIQDAPTDIGGFGAARNVIAANSQGILITDTGGSGGNSFNNAINGNFIGTDASGNGIVDATGTSFGNRGPGVSLSGDVRSATLSNNVIANNSGNGVLLQTSGNFAPSNSTLQGNIIGTNASGDARRPNALGVVIQQASSTLIVGNTVSGNTGDGVVIQNATGTQLSGNRIGLSPTGDRPLSNTNNGIFIVNSPGTRVGLVGAAPNIVSANGANGIFWTASNGVILQNNYIGTDATGSTITFSDGVSTSGLGNTGAGVRVEASSANLIGGDSNGAGNLIAGNGRHGIELAYLNTASSNNTIQGNLIGTDAGGTLDLGNGMSGLFLDRSGGNAIGGAGAARNVISGNTQDGIFLQGSDATGNRIQGNTIGLTKDGGAALGNGFSGIILFMGPSDNLIGGSTVGEGNIISANSSGIVIQDATSLRNTIQGNLVGTDQSGLLALGNRFYGINIAGASETIIGGETAAARNIISANGFHGIVLHNKATKTRISGNYIGTDTTGTAPLGNLLDGIQIENAPANTVGGTTAGARNVISANGRDGVRLFDMDAKGNLVQGNAIGTQQDGAQPLGNSGSGVYDKNAPQNVIGLALDNTGAGNIIAFNRQSGVALFQDMPDAAIGNTIRGNATFSNGRLGIDLDDDGVTPNDTDDPDPGANNRQNFPVITGVPVVGATTTIQGTLNSTPNKIFLLDFYRSASPDPSGFGEGQRYIGRAQVTTNASGDTAFSFSFASGTVNTGQYVAATATNTETGDSSEFSATRLIQLTISGHIYNASGQALPNVSVALSGGPTTATTTTNSTGYYTFSDVLSGSYEVAPTLIGYTFSPPSRTVQVTNSEVTEQNFIGIPAPTVTGFTPALGAVGAAVTITGTNFTGATVVQFNTTSAMFTVNSATQIMTKVPAGATTGKISVTTPGGTGSSTANFSVDTAPTSVTITTPADGSLVSSLSVINGGAIDNVGGSGINRVSVTLLRPRGGGVYEYWNSATGQWQGTAVSRNATLSAPNALSTNWVINSSLPSGSNLASGPYFLTALAYDNAGLSTSSGTKRFTVDSTAPTSVTITTPADGSLVSSLSVINGGAIDNVGGSGINRVSVTLLRPRGGGVYEYWNSATGQWQGTAVSRNATLSAPNALSTNWVINSSLPGGANLPPGTYFLTAYAYDNVGKAAFSGTKRFTVPVPTYSISGRVVNSAGVGIANVSVKRSGSSVVVLTNATGYYTLTSVPAGSYVITPSLAGRSFSPVSRTVSLTTANATNVNFIGSG